MAFDPVLSSQLNKLKPQVGSLALVSSNFSSPDYIDTGSMVDEVKYPKLAALISKGFKGDVFKERSFPSFSGNLLSTANATSGASLFRGMFKWEGQLYAITHNGTIFATTDGTIATLAYHASLSVPDGAISSMTVPTVHGNMLYLSMFVAGTTWVSYRIDLNDLTFKTLTKLTMPSANSFLFKSNGDQILAIQNTIAGNTVAYTSDGTTFLSRSTTWTATYTPKGIEYGNGVWVVVTSGTGASNIATSPDGVTWTARSVGTVGHNAVRYSAVAGLFVAVAATTAAAVFTSPDGVAWTSRTITAPANAFTVIDVTSTGVFIAYTTMAGSNPFQTSTNGINWTVRQSGPFAHSAGQLLPTLPMGFCVDDTMYLFAATANNNSSIAPQINYTSSTDGFATYGTIYSLKGRKTKINRAPIFIAGDQIGLIFDSTISVQARSFYALRTTDGGETWNEVTCTFTGGLTPVCQPFLSTMVATPDRFFMRVNSPDITGSTGTMGYATSEDGINWTIISGLITATQVAENVLYNYGTNSSYRYSTDWGVTWNSRGFSTVLAATGLLHFAAGPNFFSVNPAGGPSAVIFGNGSHSIMNLPTTTGGVANSVVYVGDGKYAMALVNSSVLYISEDGGVNWFIRSLPVAMSSTNSLSALNDCLYYLVSPGFAYRSFDLGATWDLIRVGLSSNSRYAHVWNGLIPNSDGTKAVMGSNTASASLGFYLETSSDHRTVPKVPSSMSGSKWVIKAK